MDSKTILYISKNEGSDPRVNKEIKSLSQCSNVIFLGVSNTNENCYVSIYCKEVILIKGRMNSLFTIIKQIFTVGKLLITKKINSVHIVNEQLAIFFYPYLFFKHTVIDVFDSYFLKKGFGGEKLNWLKRLVYYPANKLIVTDENRLNLMPNFVRKKCIVLPNYPESVQNEIKKSKSNELRIMYVGRINISRGSKIVEGLLKLGLPIKIYLAGWVSDDFTKNLMKAYQKNIVWLGVLKQKEIMEITQEKIDYILCVYDPSNFNNLNASPNKVYDAIQSRTPIIMNKEVKLSEWVLKEEVGVITKEFYIQDFDKLYDILQHRKDTFKSWDRLSKKYTWESVENQLFASHNICCKV